MDTKAVTIVTGGGRGIGRAIAKRMSLETAVIIVGRGQGDLEAACEEIDPHGLGNKAFYARGDVADPETARRAIRTCLERGLRIQNLVCNAGIGKSGPTEEYDTDLWKIVMDVNVNGTFHFIKACLPSMIEAKSGNICIMSSVSGLLGSKQNAAYVASKHALVGMAKALAKEHGKNGIVTVAICPGYVETEMTARSIDKRVRFHGITPEQAREKIVNENPQKRIIQPEEVAEAVAFVCSGKVPSLSGSSLVLSGGV